MNPKQILSVKDASQRFVDYYDSLGYHQLASTSLLDPSIPMSFVMSAGMVQVELGLEEIQEEVGNKFMLVQQCFRHFDLKKIGKSPTHMSIFEMPGAFIFGVNNRAETIMHMWRLAIDILGLDPASIWVTYFSGGEIIGEQIAEDIATREAWLRVGCAPERVIGLGVKHNYWMQGKGIGKMPGPRKCGPNTELFFDRGEEYACSVDCSPGCKCGQRFVEFSNSLFISHAIDEEKNVLYSLDQKFTETVIGLERVAMISQGVNSVFEIEEHKGTIEVIYSLIPKSEGTTELLSESVRVIYDHLKALYYLVGYGAPPPGKGGRERIIKLLIRGIITRERLLGINTADFPCTILEAIIGNAEKDWDHQKILQRVLWYYENEKKRFEATIERGYRQLHRYVQESNGNCLSGKQLLYLEKRMGLPALLAKHKLDKEGCRYNEQEYLSLL